MSEGMVPRIVEQVGHVAGITGNQASLLARQSEYLGEARRQIDAVMEGTNDQEAGQLLAHLGEAAQKTGDAAAILAELKAKVEHFAGNIATGSSVKSRTLFVTQEGVIERDHIERTIQSRSTRSAELSDDPWAVKTREDLRRKIFFFNKGATPADAEMQGTVRTAMKIDENITAQMEPDSSLRTELNTFIAETDTYDRFNLQEKATAIVDTLLDGAEGEKDMADLIIVHAGFRRVSGAAEDEAKKQSGMSSNQRQKIAEHLADLKIAVDQEMIHRLDDSKIVDGQQIDLEQMYEQMYRGLSDDRPNNLMYYNFDSLGVQVNDRVMLDGLIRQYDLADAAAPNDYNRPLSAKEKAKLDEAAAATIEGVHLLKTYGITPLVVEGKDVGRRYYPASTNGVGCSSSRRRAC